MPPVEYKVLNFPMEFGEHFESMKEECGNASYNVNCFFSGMDRWDHYNIDYTTGTVQLKISPEDLAKYK